jgi:hypothetical protein
MTRSPRPYPELLMKIGVAAGMVLLIALIIWFVPAP